MTLVDVIATVVLDVIIGGAVAYIVRAKKNGQKCIGCPGSKTCSSKKNGGCGCGCDSEKETRN